MPQQLMAVLLSVPLKPVYSDSVQGKEAPGSLTVPPLLQRLRALGVATTVHDLSTLHRGGFPLQGLQPTSM